jgi:hypothetical protein
MIDVAKHSSADIVQLGDLYEVWEAETYCESSIAKCAMGKLGCQAAFEKRSAGMRKECKLPARGLCPRTFESRPSDTLRT